MLCSTVSNSTTLFPSRKHFVKELRMDAWKRARWHESVWSLRHNAFIHILLGKIKRSGWTVLLSNSSHHPFRQSQHLNKCDLISLPFLEWKFYFLKKVFLMKSNWEIQMLLGNIRWTSLSYFFHLLPVCALTGDWTRNLWCRDNTPTNWPIRSGLSYLFIYIEQRGIFFHIIYWAPILIFLKFIFGKHFFVILFPLYFSHLPFSWQNIALKAQ